MKLIVGLGNPEAKYDNTRHNIGFMALDYFAKENKLSFKEKKNLKGLVALTKEYILLKPKTYMNLSGEAVQLVLSYYKIDVKDILIISDDFNIPFSTIRIREKGSSGGHNGLKSIIQSLSTEDFSRLRIGLGNPNFGAIDFVLGKFSQEETKKLDQLFKKTNSIIKDFVFDLPFSELQNKYNSNEPIS